MNNKTIKENQKSNHDHNFEEHWEMIKRANLRDLEVEEVAEM
jgi:hypothetical protein